MDPDQKFCHFIQEWAKNKECRFEIEDFDGRESPDLIDGMAVDDVWGWLLQEGENEKTDDNFGCLEWSIVDGKLHLEWNTHED